jgi:hypothetical protein
LVVSAAAALTAATPAAPVSATLAVDAPFAIYAGAADGTALELVAIGGSAASPGAPTPENFRFETEDDRYIYIAVWGDRESPRGVLGELVFNGLVVLSGDPAWEVCPAVLDVSAGAPRPSEVTAQIRRANRRFTWVKAANLSLNEAAQANAVAGIAGQAAWMWLPSDAPRVAEAESNAQPNAIIFRIAPNKLWPEFDLSNERNAGYGPRSGATISGESRYAFPGGGGGGGGSSSSSPTTGGSDMFPAPQPALDSNPLNSSTTPARTTPQTPVTPLLPSTPGDTPSTPTPPADEPTRPTPPTPPPTVPEPTTASLLLAVSAALRRR